MSFTTGSFPPFANPAIAELAAQLDASLGQANGLSQYLNQSLGEAISANAQIINAVVGQPNITLVTLDHASLCYTTAGPLNVTLPPIGGVGRMCEVIKASVDANGVTVNTPAGITFVDGTTQFNLYNQNDYVDIICNPANLQWSIRGYRQRGLPVNGGFSGLAGAAQIQQSAITQIIPNNTLTTVQFNTNVIYDTGLPTKYFSSSVPNVFTAQTNGIFLITGSMQFTASTESSGEIILYISIANPHGGSVELGAGGTAIPAAGNAATISVANMVQLTSGSQVYLSVLQNSGAGLGINSSASSPPLMSILQVA